MSPCNYIFLLILGWKASLSLFQTKYLQLIYLNVMPKSSFFSNAIHVNFKQNAMNYHCDSNPISSSNYQLEHNKQSSALFRATMTMQIKSKSIENTFGSILHVAAYKQTSFSLPLNARFVLNSSLKWASIHRGLFKWTYIHFLPVTFIPHLWKRMQRQFDFCSKPK